MKCYCVKPRHGKAKLCFGMVLYIDVMYDKRPKINPLSLTSGGFIFSYKYYYKIHLKVDA